MTVELILAVTTQTVMQFWSSKRELKLFKSQHKHYLMPHERCFTAGKTLKFPTSDWNFLEFVKMVEAGEKELLSRRNIFDIDVPRYPEVFPLKFPWPNCSYLSKHFSLWWSKSLRLGATSRSMRRGSFPTGLIFLRSSEHWCRAGSQSRLRPHEKNAMSTSTKTQSSNELRWPKRRLKSWRSPVRSLVSSLSLESCPKVWV